MKTISNYNEILRYFSELRFMSDPKNWRELAKQDADAYVKKYLKSNSKPVNPEDEELEYTSELPEFTVSAPFIVSNTEDISLNSKQDNKLIKLFKYLDYLQNKKDEKNKKKEDSKSNRTKSLYVSIGPDNEADNYKNYLKLFS